MEVEPLDLLALLLPSVGDKEVSDRGAFTILFLLQLHCDVFKGQVLSEGQY